MHKEDPEFKKTILNHTSNPVLVKLKDIIKNKLEEKTRIKVTKVNYQDSAWAYVQADLNGEERSLAAILELLNFVEDKK